MLEIIINFCGSDLVLGIMLRLFSMHMVYYGMISNLRVAFDGFLMTINLRGRGIGQYSPIRHEFFSRNIP